MRWLAAGGCVAATLAPPAGPHAGTVHLEKGHAPYDVGPGEANRVEAAP